MWRLTEKLLVMISLSIAHPMIIQVPVCFCTLLCIFLLCAFILSYHSYAMYGKLLGVWMICLDINLRISADPLVFLQGLASSDGTDFDIPCTNTMSANKHSQSVAHRTGTVCQNQTALPLIQDHSRRTLKLTTVKPLILVTLNFGV